MACKGDGKAKAVLIPEQGQEKISVYWLKDLFLLPGIKTLRIGRKL